MVSNYPRPQQPVYKHLEFPGTSGCFQAGSKVFSERSRPFRSIYADVNTCQGNKACGHARPCQPWGCCKRQLESHMSQQWKIHMQLFLALECIHRLPAQQLCHKALENCESAFSINKSRTLPGPTICQLKERPRFMVSLGARGGNSGGTSRTGHRWLSLQPNKSNHNQKERCQLWGLECGWPPSAIFTKQYSWRYPYALMDKESADGLLFKDHDFSSDLLRQLNGLRQSRILTDVIICVGAWEVPCHRNVLASSSPYFRAMFCSNFRESGEAKVQLRGIDSTTLEQLILYVYTGEAPITAENVLPLLEAASMLQYPKLFEACSSYLQSQLTPSNCLGMIRLSEILSCETLKRTAREVALTYFPEVAASADLKELCALELRDYLGDDGLCGEEEKVFEAFMGWVKHDLQTRKRYMQELFELVRLPYVHPGFFHHFIANDALLRSSPSCQIILETARRQMRSLYGTTSVPDLQPPWHVPPRTSYQDFLILLGGRKDSQQTTRDVLLYHRQTGQWRSLAKLPTRLYKAAAVALHRGVYVLGGMAVGTEKSEPSRHVYIFSLKLNQWRLGQPMLAARYSHRSTSHKNFIFSIGGIGEGQEVLGSMERYDSVCNAWENMASMPVGVLHPAVAVKDQRLYLFGGEDIMQNPVRLIQVYHISRNTWFKMETRMIKNVCAPAVVLGERIVIVGGYTRRILAYDPQSNKFVKCADMKDRRMHHGAAVMGNKLYVTGGRRLTTDCHIEDSASFDCYDPETDTWTSQGQLPHKLFDHACLALQCIPHASTFS